MTNKLENPPAFPLPLGTMNRAEPSQSGGMSLRDYFAAAVELPWNALLETYRINKKIGSIEPTVNQLADYSAEIRYIFADAMLKARGE